MRYFLALVLFCSLILGSNSSVFLERLNGTHGRKGECYDKKQDKIYKVGEEMPWDGSCGVKFCRANKFGSYAETIVCTKRILPPECRLVPNDGKPYPDCCGFILCEENPKTISKSNKIY